MSRILHACTLHRDLVHSFNRFIKYNKAGLQEFSGRTLTATMTNGDTHVWVCTPERMRGMEFDAAIVDEWVDGSSVEDAQCLRQVIPTRVRPR